MRLLKKLWKVFENNLLWWIFVGIWVLIMLFINFNTQVANNAQVAKETAQSTNHIVKKQDETLQAIKDLATDNKLTSKQLGDTIICMLQVPIAQRTTQVQDQCRSQALSGSSTIAPQTPQSSQSNTTPQKSVSNSSTTQNTTTQPPASSSPSFIQRDVVQPINNLWDNIKGIIK